MYLKQIEIHGFKSFANETVLKFEKGITGIVGPNGSGKSNIADAVRWVLGERSMKQLRGADTQDVIFAGTEHRKAQGFAYVSLLIDNSDKKLPLDFDEVQVSRRLYRSGESEYKLNNIECRLKDINEIFYDTGIGKEGYSIIGQGQIDKILSNKPEDRRELFDEAVGIVKYKRRKAIAEKKLEEERLNLSRVTDIINEIDRQIGPLKKQAEAAKQYFSLRDDLLLYESNYFVREVEKESKIIEETNEKIEINKNDIKLINEKKIAFNEKYAEIDNMITKLDLEISDLKDELTENSTLKEQLKGEVNVLNEQINSINLNNKGRIDRIESLKKNIFTSIEHIENNLGILSVLKNQIELIKENDTDINENDSQMDIDLNIINDTINETKQVVYRVMGEEYNLDLNIQNSNSVFTEDNLFNNMNDERKKLLNIENNIKLKFDEVDRLNDILNQTNFALDELNENIMQKQNIFHSEETKLDTIKNMLERYEGFTNTVKIILDNKSMFKGVIGAVADIIETKKDYEVAIEVALGNTIQNVVTDNVETSKDIIKYLKDNKLGRITTLPLDVLQVKDNETYKKAKNEKGVIDIAVNLTNFNKQYEKLANYLLQRCLIVDNYDNAKEIFKKYNSSIKLITLQGELFNPGGAISGGSFKNSSTLIGRKREYEELIVSISNLKNDIDILKNKKLNLSEEYDKNYNDLEKVKSAINELNIEKNTINLSIISEMKLKYSNISNKTEYVTSDLKKLNTNLEDFYLEKTKYESEDVNFSSIITEKNDAILNFNSKISELDTKCIEIENKINDKTKEKENGLSNRKEYYESRDKITTELIKLEHESNILSNTIEKSNIKIAEISNSMLEDYNLTYVTAKENYKEDLGSIDEIKKLVKEKRKVIQELGPINVNAIEEYKAVGDRYELMTSQYDDIKKAEEMIANIANELDKNMRIQFEENFKKIKVEFEDVFKKLFGGGKANLELVEIDEKGILDAGVSIVVQPPGKKLGNMMQLSGGEKALTAIALLFAIQNLKPSPFCLLDEIEAALDESNVDRFAEYLKNLTVNTQFILITHRRGTMEKADQLYGITMQEKGVTALVSVDLVEEELT